MKILKKVINKFLMKTAISHLPANDKTVYITFDDGPEPGITEFVLDELKKYNYKATFFCTGKNVEKHPELIEKILKEGHALGNHTYSHIKAYDIGAKDYVKDVERAGEVIHTHLFRPPNGCLTLEAWLRLRRHYKIIFWTIGSGDWRKDSFEYETSIKLLKSTKAGNIILFHFSNDLEEGTRRLLPDYLEWMTLNNYKTDILR